MGKFQKQEDISEILKTIAAYSARAEFMRNQVVRSNNDSYVQFRVYELDPFIKAVQFQFSVWSRIHSVKEADYKMSTGVR